MKNETLSHILRNLKLSKCKLIKENIYYVKKNVRTVRYDSEIGQEEYSNDKYEFLVIAENGIKKAIILNFGNIDLHWYVFKKWRGQHILSNALRSGVIKEIWPKINTVTSCCDYSENKEEKFKMTEHLASLAGLGISEEESLWIH